MFIPRKKESANIARALRKNATREEKHLWYDYLSGYSLHFTRQKIIGEYIADFYCHAAKLVIELDGSQHYTSLGRAYDNERMEYMKSLGIETLRFSNLDIRSRFFDVCRMIDKTIKERMGI